MENKHYELTFLPLFEQDLNEAVDYITNTLNSPQAAVFDWIGKQFVRNRQNRPFCIALFSLVVKLYLF